MTLYEASKLKIETQIQEDHQARLKVTFEKEQFEQAKQKAARKIANRAKIPGFRPGKAPYAVIVRQFGEAAVIEEAVEIIVDESYAHILRQAEIQPYAPGSLEQVESLDPLTLEFLVPLMPEVELGDYRSIRFPYQTPTVDDQMTEENLESLRKRAAVIEPVQRPIQAQDLVVLRLSARLAPTQEGTEEVLIEEKVVPLLVAAENDETEWPFEGFSNHLLGMSEGDEKTVTYTYPEEHANTSFKGKQVEFRFKVESIKERKLPELNDEFAATFEGISTVEELRQAVRKDLSTALENEYEEAYLDQVIDALLAMATIKYPPQIIEEETQSVLEALADNLKQNNMSLEIYLKARQMTQEDLEKEARQVAEKRVRQALAINKVAELEGIDVEAEVQQAFQELNQSVDANMRAYIRAGLKRRKAVQRLLEIARGASPDAEQLTQNEAEAQPLPTVEQAVGAASDEDIPHATAYPDNDPLPEE